jgi:plastocyanin
VKLGTQVTWTNRDEVEHTVTAIPGDTLMFDGVVPAGSKYSYTFTRTGDFPYVCRIHAGMRGTISVTQ